MKLALRTELLTPPGTSKMRTIANELKASGVPVVNFAAGELDVQTSEIVQQHAHAAISDSRNVYTPALGLPSLRKLISQLVTRHTRLAYLPAEVGVTAGAKQALFNAAMVLLNPGDEVIIPRPYWVTFPSQVELAGATPVFVDTRPHGYRLLADSIRSAITARSRAVIINSPNNPTGAICSGRELVEIARLAKDHSLWIIFDECYASLIRNGHEHVNVVQADPTVKDRTVLINSFSKSHAMTGWRLGYVAAPAPVIAAMENLQGHTTSNPNSIAQYAIEGALTADDNGFIRNVNGLLQQRHEIATGIVAGIEGVSIAPAEGAFYLFIDVSSRFGKRYRGRKVTDVDVLCELALSEANVALVSGAAFGDPSGVRLSYAIATTDVSEGLARLAGFLDEIK